MTTTGYVKASVWDWCLCGHPMLLHDVEDMDGSNPTCCVEGCDQRGCAGAEHQARLAETKETP